MHLVYEYPVKFTWTNSIKSENYIGSPIMTEHNMEKYYPETNDTPKGHFNQSRKNVRSTKPNRTPLKEPSKSTLRGRKAQNLYTNVYEVRNTVFSNWPRG